MLLVFLYSGYSASQLMSIDVLVLSKEKYIAAVIVTIIQLHVLLMNTFFGNGVTKGEAYP